MRNRFNINESEKNRIRKLHGMKVLNEVSELGVDLETELDMDLSNVSQNESDWEKDNWDELDDEQKETFRAHDEFKDLEEDEVKEKYNNMEKGPLRDIIKNIVSWFRRLFGKDKDEYTKSKMSEDSVFKKIEGEIFKGVGKSYNPTLASTTAEYVAAAKIWKAAGLSGDVDRMKVPMFQVERPKDRRSEARRGVKKIDGMYINTQYWKVHQV